MAESAGVEFDTAGLIMLQADMGKSVAMTAAAVRVVVQASSARVKSAMIADAQANLGSGSARHFPQSITYETRELAAAAEGIIGPDKDRVQGALGNILYFGTSNNPPVLNLTGPLEAEEPHYIAALAAAAEKALG